MQHEPAAFLASSVPTHSVGHVHLNDVELSFEVTLDEEYVRLYMKYGGRVVDMGERVHNYVLLLLARQRINDRRAGLSDTACGWIDQEEWSHDPSLQPNRVSVDLCRLRKELARFGVADADRIVERRARSRQLRIGIDRLSIVTV
jgi:hypothetical protein